MFFGRAAQFLLALAMTRVATTILSPEEMGRVSLVLTTTAFFAFLLVSPVGMFINRRLHTWQAAGTARYYLMRYVNHLFLVALTAAIVLGVLHLTGGVNFGMSLPWQVLLICGSLIIGTINLTAIPSLNLLGYGSIFVLLSVATIAASFGCAALFVLSVQPAAQYWLLGLLLGQAIVGAIGTRTLFGRLTKPLQMSAKPGIHTRHLRVLFEFAWPVSIAAGLGWVQGQGYRYVMESNLGLTQLGLFVAGYGISAGIIAGFESLITGYFQPKLYHDASKGSSSVQKMAWQKYASAVIPSMLMTAGFVAITAPELARMLLGTQFQSAAIYIVWGSLAEAARVLVVAYSLMAHIHMQTRRLILPNLIGAAVSILLSVTLIPVLGAEGAAIALVLSGFGIVATMHFSFMRDIARGSVLRALPLMGISSIILWALTTVLRHGVNNSDKWSSIFVLLPVGGVFLGLQYLSLRQYIAESKSFTKPTKSSKP